MALTKEEINRKLLHLFALAMPAGIFYLPRFSVPVMVPIVILAVLLVGSIIVENLRFRYPAVQKIFYAMVGHMLRKEEAKSTTGSTYVIGAALLCSILFIHNLHIAFIVLFLFILGDAIAALVGIGIGRIKIGKKSLEGSLACFTLCMILIYGLFPFFPWVLDTWNGQMPILLGVVTSLSITIFELVPLRITKSFVINDNLAVPVITGFIILGLSKVM